MDQADNPRRRLHFHRKGQGTQSRHETGFGSRITVIEPGAAMLLAAYVWDRIANGAPPGHQVMIAADRVDPLSHKWIEHSLATRSSMKSAKLLGCAATLMFSPLREGRSPELKWRP
ncbi:hypothetical protein [Achromobacter aloeverae]